MTFPEDMEDDEDWVISITLPNGETVKMWVKWEDGTSIVDAFVNRKWLKKYIEDVAEWHLIIETDEWEFIDTWKVTGENGKDGKDWKNGNNYILTNRDKEEIAREITVPIVEKVIERTEVIKEQPIITNEIKEVAMYEDWEQIVKKINDLELDDDKKIDAKHIKNLPESTTIIRNVASWIGIRNNWLLKTSDVKSINFTGSSTVTDNNGNVTVDTSWWSWSSITLKTNWTNNGSQSILDLKAGANITLTDDGVGWITMTATGWGSGWGDMYKSVYDVNNNGIVDNSQALWWQAGSYYLDRANHTGTQTASTISDFSTTVSANSDVSANTSARHTHSNKTILDNTTASYTTAEQTKLWHITVTQAVDLDQLETRVNDLDAAVILKGTWDASSGVFPWSWVAQAGWSYIVSVAGTVNSVSFWINDRIIAITDNASTSTFASNRFKADYTDQVLSVAGKTGTVTLDKNDVWLGNVDNTTDLNKPISTATQAALDAKVTANSAITWATKTKITYDAKWLVTAWADATTADIADSTNKRYVTDAQLTVIGNTSGTNTWDVTLAWVPNYITIVGQTITRALIDLASHVTGKLPFANLANGTAHSVVGRAWSGSWDVANISAWNDTILARNGSWDVDFQSTTTVKTMLALNNVDNTSDATKNSATATLTNKTISGANNTITNIAEWSLALTDITTNNATSARHGFLPKLENSGTKYLRDDGTWQTVSGGSSSKEIRITIPWQLSQDTGNYQGLYWKNTTGATVTISNVAVCVGKAAAGAGAACSVNIYKSSGTASDWINTSAVALFSSAIALGTSNDSLTNVPTTTTVENGKRISLRVTASAWATNKASDLQCIITY